MFQDFPIAYSAARQAQPLNLSAAPLSIITADDWVVNANYKYRSAIDEMTSEDISALADDSHRLDLTLSVKVAAGRGEWMAGVTDLFDQTDQMIPSYPAVSTHETPGRTLFTRIQIGF